MKALATSLAAPKHTGRSATNPRGRQRTVSAASPQPGIPTDSTLVRSLAGRDLLSMSDLTSADLGDLLDLAIAAKADPSLLEGSLAGTSTIMLFEKPSLRTRVSFEVGITRMGGHAMYFDHGASRIGSREPAFDYALNLERWVDCIVARVHSQATLAEMAQHGSIPVVNALCDIEHPCQAIADVMTLKEHLAQRGRELAGARLAYIGDGNNVCHSLLLACAKLGIDMTAITPHGFEPQFEVIRKAQADALASGAELRITNNADAIEGHDAVYTDVWTSMGQDHQKPLREGVFEPYRVTEELMDTASRGMELPTLFMHCLPAKRGMEVEAGVIDGPSSIVYDQAENRMHAQNALLASILAPGA